GDGSSSDEWRDYDMSGEDYKGPPVFDDDQYEEELMRVYDTAIEDVIEEEEGFVGKGEFGGEEDNIEDVVVVANDLFGIKSKVLIKIFPRRSEDEDLEYPFFEGDGSSSDEWRDYDMSGEDYKGPPVFDDDQYEEELMRVYDTAIEDVIEEEEGFVGKGEFGGEEDNIEDVVVVANDLCSSIIQTSINVDFSKTVDSNPHELIWLQKGVTLKQNLDIL
nr:hypothetical protein [Tanacetum cinerariifolium]